MQTRSLTSFTMMPRHWSRDLHRFLISGNTKRRRGVGASTGAQGSAPAGAVRAAMCTASISRSLAPTSATNHSSASDPGSFPWIKQLNYWHRMDQHERTLLWADIASWQTTISDQVFKQLVRSVVRNMDRPVADYISDRPVITTLYARLHCLSTQQSSDASDDRLCPHDIETMLQLLAVPTTSPGLSSQNNMSNNYETPISVQQREKLLDLLAMPLGDVNRRPIDALHALAGMDKAWSSIDSTLQLMILKHLKALISEYAYYDKSIYPKFPAHIESEALLFLQQLVNVRCNFHVDLVIDQINVGVQLTCLLAKILTKNPVGGISGVPHVLNALSNMACTWEKISGPCQTAILQLSMLGLSHLNQPQLIEAEGDKPTARDWDVDGFLYSLADIGATLPIDQSESLLAFLSATLSASESTSTQQVISASMLANANRLLSISAVNDSRIAVLQSQFAIEMKPICAHLSNANTALANALRKMCEL